MNTPEQFTRSGEYLPRPAVESDTTDWRRIEVASHRFGDFIAGGIAKAVEQRTDIEKGTARTIAHVLGRGIGRMSALADFGRTGDGDYERIRDEYLTLYQDPDAPAWAREQIDWLGTFLIHRDFPNAQTTDHWEQRPFTLEKLLVPTVMVVDDRAVVTHVPGNYGSSAIADLGETLLELQAHEDAGLRAFLSLPDVNAMSGRIMEDFDEHYVRTYRDIEDAVHELAEVDEREREVTEYASERHLFFDTIQPDFEALIDEAREGYDFVEEEGRVYVFSK
ncbi:hypothetical protein ICL81_06655 [Leucobacter sp. cx-328]|uniref:hypothetical protein n=1 Tax=unclassified Leucobacter TaxID=2621730 RepID=UPI00165D7FA8|nr:MULTISPECIES: hypothetical protein [unclassified Leucobacter]MBC9944193.1 hypothetical protein [Leucobacter sp. cx-328]